MTTRAQAHKVKEEDEELQIESEVRAHNLENGALERYMHWMKSVIQMMNRLKKLNNLLLNR